MTLNALLKLYIGNGLRRDVSRQYAERVRNATAQALATRGVSQEVIAEILDKIRTTVRSS
jgi:ribosome-binding protein aMBF1 (putative translation factor)